MEDNQETPRTIQMKYPAPYSQTLSENESTAVSQKKSKRRIYTLSSTERGECWCSVIQVDRLAQTPVFPNLTSHAPPHSQSWANEKSTKKSKKKTASPRLGATQIVYPLPFTKTAANYSEQKITRPKKSSVHQRMSHKVSSAPVGEAPWQPVKPKMRGPDPTLPHLKYGLFSQKKNTEQNQVQVVNVTGAERKTLTSTAENSSKKVKKIKDQNPEAEAPMFVFRAIDHRFTRQLSVSAPTHVDIRPRTKTPAQIYAPVSPPNNEGRTSSTFRNNNVPTLSITPLKKSFQRLSKKNIEDK